MNESRAAQVMVVDDSAILRRILKTIINEQRDLQAPWTAVNGAEAVSEYKKRRPDLVLMDVEMPVMTGMQALREILDYDAAARIVMCSQWTGEGTLAALEAMEAGASDCIGKPSSALLRGDVFEQQLLHKLRSAIGGKLRKVTPPSMPAESEKKAGLSLRPFPNHLASGFAQVLAIGSSTGGPRALIEVLAHLDPKLPVPIVITQHIPVGFSAYLAKAIASKTPFVTQEATEGMVLQAGQVYLAPSGMHMGFARKSGQVLVRLIDGPPVNYCKPSIEVMLDSLREVYGQGIVTVLLTGMGNDGEKACERLVATRENILLAQDKASSVVWGIPGAVAQRGLCHAVLPLEKIGANLTSVIRHRCLHE